MTTSSLPAASLPAALSTAFGDRPRYDEPLADHTTLRLGGPAEVWLAVDTVDELVTAIRLAYRHACPVFIMGSGANLLVGDGGMRGLVIENRAGQVEFPPQRDGALGEKALLAVDSGVALPSLARRCAKRGLSGMEWAVGVPGTMGGAVVNNAGAFGRDIAGSLNRAELLSPGLERIWQPVEWFMYAYRFSRLKAQPAEVKWVVLRAELHLERAPATEIESRMVDFNERRKTSQPPGATIGSMFKNPPGDYAGRLIEAAGLKGYRQGQAQISPVHANFFQNLGGATAAEVMALIQMARSTVENKFGIALDLEIEVVGEFGG